MTLGTKGPVIFNTGYRRGLGWEGVQKYLLRNSWGTKLFQTPTLGDEFFIKHAIAFLSFPRRDAFQRALQN